MWAMMQKFRICAGAVKVLSAKLLMGISWSTSNVRGAARPFTGGSRACPAYLCRVVETYLDTVAAGCSRLCCEYGLCPEIAVEDVPAVCRESGVQRGPAAGPTRTEFPDRPARAAAGRADHRERHRRRGAATVRRDGHRSAGDQQQ